jgi:hypothetical protein
MQQAADGYAGPFKIRLACPWTLLRHHRAGTVPEPGLADPGAVADLIASLAEGTAAHVAEVRNRLPAATVVLQLDEPAVPAVLAGAVPTASGLNRVGAVDTTVTSDGLRAVLTAGAAFSVVHCCAPDYPFGMIKDSGAGAISFDAQQLRPGPNQIAELSSRMREMGPECFHTRATGDDTAHHPRQNRHGDRALAPDPSAARHPARAVVITQPAGWLAFRPKGAALPAARRQPDTASRSRSVPATVPGAADGQAAQRGRGKRERAGRGAGEPR